MEAWKQELLQLPGRQDETEWLRYRLEVMSVREEIVLSAARQYQPPKTAADMINRILSIPYYNVCAEAGSYAALGEFFLKYESPVTLPNDAFAFVDMETLGKRYEDMHPGLFVGNNYVVCPEPDFRPPQYDGVYLPQQDYDWSLRLKLGSAAKPEGVWVCLPDYNEISEEKPGDIEIAFQELEVEHNGECTLLNAKCPLSGITGRMEYGDLADLIYDGQNLGIILDERGQGQPYFIERFQAALELEGCDTLKEAIDISQNLHCYDLVLANDLEHYGQKALHHEYIHIQDGSEIFSDCIDYKGYARQLLEQKGFQCVLNGKAYVARNDQTFVSEYAQSPPEMTM